VQKGASVNNDRGAASRYFLSYSGVRLPLKLVGALESGEIENRNTYYHGRYDEHDRLVHCEKIVYGEVELEHSYFYYDTGAIMKAEIRESGEELKVISFDAQGAAVC
jgi:hypothetical protein